jgi:hypothetical protein
MDIQDYKDSMNDIIARLDVVYEYYKTLRDIYNSIARMESLLESTDMNVREESGDFLAGNRLSSERLAGYLDRVERTSWVSSTISELWNLSSELMDEYQSGASDEYLDLASDIQAIAEKQKKRFKKLNL